MPEYNPIDEARNERYVKVCIEFQKGLMLPSELIDRIVRIHDDAADLKYTLLKVNSDIEDYCRQEEV